MLLINKSYTLIGFIGTLLIAYGLALPTFIPSWSLFILENINESIELHDSGQLLISSFAFVGKYTIIFFFLYFGAMFLAHSLAKSLHSLVSSLLFITLTTIAIFTFNQIYQEHFSYLGHVLTTCLIVLLMPTIVKQRNFYFIYSIVLFLILMASQWVQLIPALSHLGLGSNDIAVAIKIADSFFTETRLFNTLATIFFIAFISIAIILTVLIHLMNKQFFTLKKYQEQAEELKETRVALAESTVYQEINTLVHDLKTPLVTVEGLISLIHMKLKIPEDNTLHDYFVRMDISLEKMKDMISEILYEDIKQDITIKELLAYVTSHLDLNEQQIELEIDLEDNLPSIHVNKIRFSRALSNILENAVTSFAGKRGFIRIYVKRVRSGILIRIQDNGPGIEALHLQNIWRDGFSTNKSSGLGLSFVKRVVENHFGTVTVNTIPGSYTQMNIILPSIKEGDENNEHYNLNSR